MSFDERKVSQMAAYFLARQGGRMPILKLMKLLYLADRESLDRYEEPISGDRMVSMPHGPVLSRTYELMNGSEEGRAQETWDAWMSDREGYVVGLREDPAEASREKLVALSDAEMEVLQTVWQKFGHLGKYEIRDLTHEICTEWTDPNGSSKPIPYSDVFAALGRDEEQAREAADNLKTARAIDTLFANL